MAGTISVNDFGGLNVRVIRNYLPNLVRSLGIDTDPVTEECAIFTKRRWSGDVRVSAGEGNFNGTHYRDNIGIRRVGKNSWQVWTEVFYAYWNEYGSVTISARPSAAQAAMEGFALYVQQLRQLIDDAAAGKAVAVGAVLEAGGGA